VVYSLGLECRVLDLGFSAMYFLICLFTIVLVLYLTLRDPTVVVSHSSSSSSWVWVHSIQAIFHLFHPGGLFFWHLFFVYEATEIIMQTARVIEFGGYTLGKPPTLNPNPT